jgi:predicted secreted Zn-dependent protease
VKDAFDVFAGKLLLHERKHMQNAIDTAMKIEQQILALPPQQSCSDFDSLVDSLGDAVVKEGHKWDLDFDAQTQHGGTEGVVFP